MNFLELAAVAGVIIGAVLGSQGIASILRARYEKVHSDTDAMSTWNAVWVGNLALMKKEIDDLHTEADELKSRVVALERALEREQRRNRLLSTLLIEHGGTPPDDPAV